ncbi:MAG: endonuclease/exonuclease/phosphatase family protein [Pseudomonadota bacterium]
MIRWLAALVMAGAAHAAEPPPKPNGAFRIAQFNAALSRRNPGELVQELRLGGSEQIDAVAEIIQRVQPDIILLNEVDFDARGVAADLLRRTLAEGRGGADGIDYPHLYLRPSNTGALTEHDLNSDGKVSRPHDAYGFGWFEGQYGMAILSRFLIDETASRSFQLARWADMPKALLPKDYYGAAAGDLRLSSKSHWDVAVTLPDRRTLRLLASHPTPPVFDGPEDRNGRRNHDEIRFWIDYIGGADWIVDDAGSRGGLQSGADWVVLGDLNADPADGDGRLGAIRDLYAMGQDPAPASRGGAEAANKTHRGDPALDTADWREDGGPGNLRVDHIIPSTAFDVLDAGVFWPAKDDPLRRLVGEGSEVSSDHRLIWVDLK